MYVCVSEREGENDEVVNLDPEYLGIHCSVLITLQVLNYFYGAYFSLLLPIILKYVIRNYMQLCFHLFYGGKEVI